MPWFALVWKHWSKAALLAVALALTLVSCLPALNPPTAVCSSWERNVIVPLERPTTSGSVVPPTRDVGLRSGEGLRQTYETEGPLPTRGLVPHAPIVISSDQDFVTQGWPGSGTAQDPYRIENLEISSNTWSCIDIRSTTAYFCIRECSLTGTSQGSGIYLEEVVNAIIENNLCVSRRWGIYGNLLEDCQLVNNTCWLGVYGIRVAYSQFVSLTENTCEINSAAGIRISESEHVGVARNLCVNNLYGIQALGGSMNSISENNCTGNASAGLVLNATRLIATIMNECTRNSFGIHLLSSSDCNLTMNACDNNSECGVFLTGSDYNYVVANGFCDNMYGIELRSCIYNYIGRNVIRGNLESGVYLYSSEMNHLDANVISESRYGVCAVGSQNTAVTTNTISNNTRAGILFLESARGIINYNTFMACGLELQGESNLDQAEVIRNTVNGAPLVLMQNEQGVRAPDGAGQLVLLRCRGITISHQILSKTSIGLLILYSEGVIVEDSVFAQNTRNGVEVWGSETIEFSDNSFTGNGEVGLVVHSDCSRNSARNNLFSGNILYNAVDDGVLNIFDRNFWSDYVGYDLNLDGLGDGPYFIGGQAMNRDWNPLMAPPGMTTPAQLPRWILAVVTGLLMNSLIIGVGSGLLIRYRKPAPKPASSAWVLVGAAFPSLN